MSNILIILPINNVDVSQKKRLTSKRLSAGQKKFRMTQPELSMKRTSAFIMPSAYPSVFRRV